MNVIWPMVSYSEQFGKEFSCSSVVRAITHFAREKLQKKIEYSLYRFWKEKLNYLKMDLQFSTQSSYNYDEQKIVSVAKKHATITEMKIVSAEERIAKSAQLDTKTMTFARTEQKITKTLHREKRVTAKNTNRVNILDSWMQKSFCLLPQQLTPFFYFEIFQIEPSKRCVSKFSATISASVTCVYSESRKPRIKNKIVADESRALSSKRKHTDVDASDLEK